MRHTRAMVTALLVALAFSIGVATPSAFAAADSAPSASAAPTEEASAPTAPPSEEASAPTAPPSEEATPAATDGPVETGPVETPASTPDVGEDEGPAGGPTLVSLPFSDALFTADGEPVAHDPARSARAEPIDPSRVQYVRTQWSETVYAEVDWHGDRSLVTAHVLSDRELAIAGTPEARETASIAQSLYFRYTSSAASERFVRTPDGKVHNLTHAQWVAAGSPALATADSGVYRARWEDPVWQVFADGTRVHIDKTTLAALGNPVSAAPPTQYLKLPWANAVYGVVSWTSAEPVQVTWLTPAQYQRAGRPPVTRATHIPGSVYYKWSTHAAQLFVQSPDGARHHLT